MRDFKRFEQDGYFGLTEDSDSYRAFDCCDGSLGQSVSRITLRFTCAECREYYIKNQNLTDERDRLRCELQNARLQHRELIIECRTFKGAAQNFWRALKLKLRISE